MYIKLFGPEVFGGALNDKKNPLDLCKRILFHTLVIFFPFQLKDYLGIIEKTGTANIWILILNSVAKKEFITIYFLAMESEIFVRMKFIRNCVLFSFVSFFALQFVLYIQCILLLKRIETNPAFLLLVIPVSIVSIS